MLNQKANHNQHSFFSLLSAQLDLRHPLYRLANKIE
jgi:hypothetical protein